MRLYSVIPNDTLFEKFLDNNFLRSITADDLDGTFNDMYIFCMSDLFQGDVENLINSVVAFTAPSLAKAYLDDKSVMISFETSDTNCQLFNNNVLLNYMKMMTTIEQNITNSNLSIEESEKALNLQQKLIQIAGKEIVNTKYYESFVLTSSIPTFSVKGCLIPKDNKEAINKVKQTKNCNLNCYLEETNAKINRGTENVQ